MTVTEAQGLEGWRAYKAADKQFQQASGCQRSQRETIATGAPNFWINIDDKKRHESRSFLLHIFIRSDNAFTPAPPHRDPHHWTELPNSRPILETGSVSDFDKTIKTPSVLTNKKDNDKDIWRQSINRPTQGLLKRPSAKIGKETKKTLLTILLGSGDPENFKYFLA